MQHCPCGGVPIVEITSAVVHVGETVARGDFQLVKLIFHAVLLKEWRAEMDDVRSSRRSATAIILGQLLKL